MAELTLWRQGTCTRLPFQGTPLLSQVLEQAGVSRSHPCGGRGTCGKCAVKLQGAVSAPNAAEKSAGCRLSCQVRLLGDAQVWLEASRQIQQIETGGAAAMIPAAPMDGRVGAAVDIGTTTLALKLYDLQSGALVAAQACLNPQSAVAADVMGRIGAALEGRLPLLQRQITGALEALLGEACAGAGVERVDSMVITGNTTMLYLLTGRSPASLSHAPFTADCLFGIEGDILGMKTYLPVCMNAFVGADITCAVLASGMTRKPETSLLCDIGTNGELALWKGGTLYVTSTAAGPAFEGAGISCGCGSVQGAIDRVWVEKDMLCSHTIAGEAAVGVCGSGLIDAVAAGLALGLIDETGAMEGKSMPLAPGIALLPGDIRAVQLAKAAIAAGIQTLLEAADVQAGEVTALYIAGGFGSHLNVDSAAAIGLIPLQLCHKVRCIGNGALTGAAALLMDRDLREETRTLAAASRHVNLGGDARFNANYIEQMLFAEV